MAKLTAEQKAMLDELTAIAESPDADDDFEIEVYDTNAGKGARLPFSKGSKWLYETLGIGEPPAPDVSDAGEPPAGKGGKKDPQPPAGRQGYFGRQAG